MVNVDHICFDKDGTLTNVHVYWCHTCGLRADALARRFGLPLASHETLLDAMGIDASSGAIKRTGPIGYLPRQSVIASAVGRLKELGVMTTDAAVREVFGEVDGRQQATNDYKIQLLPGVADFLKHHASRGTVLSIFSSDRRENTLKIIAALRLDSYFAAVVGGGCVSKAKPDPEGFLTACHLAGVPPAATAYVSDTVNDLQMANDGAATTTIGVATGLDTYEDLRVHASVVCRRLDELIGG